MNLNFEIYSAPEAMKAPYKIYNFQIKVCWMRGKSSKDNLEFQALKLEEI